MATTLLHTVQNIDNILSLLLYGCPKTRNRMWVAVIIAVLFVLDLMIYDD